MKREERRRLKGKSMKLKRKKERKMAKRPWATGPPFEQEQEETVKWKKREMAEEGGVEEEEDEVEVEVKLEMRKGERKQDDEAEEVELGED